MRLLSSVVFSCLRERQTGLFCSESIREGDVTVKEMTVEASVGSIGAVTAWINKELDKLDCPVKARMQIDMAIDEIFANIAMYAYPEGHGSALLRVEYEDGLVSITFIDEGIPYDPLKKEDPDITLSAEEREIGGLGIFLVKKTMDAMEYKRTDGRNILTIRKRIVK